MKGEVTAMLPQAEGHPDCRRSTHRWGGAWARPSLTASAGAKENAPLTCISFIFILWHRTIPLRVPPPGHFHKKRWQVTGAKKLLLKKKWKWTSKSKGGDFTEINISMAFLLLFMWYCSHCCDYIPEWEAEAVPLFVVTGSLEIGLWLNPWILEPGA